MTACCQVLVQCARQRQVATWLAGVHSAQLYGWARAMLLRWTSQAIASVEQAHAASIGACYRLFRVGMCNLTAVTPDNVVRRKHKRLCPKCRQASTMRMLRRCVQVPQLVAPREQVRRTSLCIAQAWEARRVPERAAIGGAGRSHVDDAHDAGVAAGVFAQARALRALATLAGAIFGVRKSDCCLRAEHQLAPT